jgi:hypothetical protein
MKPTATAFATRLHPAVRDVIRRRSRVAAIAVAPWLKMVITIILQLLPAILPLILAADGRAPTASDWPWDAADTPDDIREAARGVPIP